MFDYIPSAILEWLDLDRRMDPLREAFRRCWSWMLADAKVSWIFFWEEFVTYPSMVQGTLHIFLGIKLFLFVKIESWNFQQLFDLGFRETLQNFNSFNQTFRWHFSRGNKSCPNELKFCEVSRNNKSKRCWKFQNSILTNEKVLFLK